MNSHPVVSDPLLAVRLSSLGAVIAVQDLTGGRGRTFAVDHAPTGPGPGARTVVHLRRSGTERLEREARATRLAHAAGVAPEVVGLVEQSGALLTRWVPGHVVTQADLADAAVLRAIGATVAALHAADVGCDLPALDPLAVRRDYLERAVRRGIALPAEVTRERERVEVLARELAATAADAPRVLCHGDLVPANLVLARERGSTTDAEPEVTVLDFEYAGVAEPAFDLGGLAATAVLADAAVAVLVAGYVGRAGSAVSVERVIAWREVLRDAWVVWVALDEDLGPERDRWRAWVAEWRVGLPQAGDPDGWNARPSGSVDAD